MQAFCCTESINAKLDFGEAVTCMESKDQEKGTGEGTTSSSTVKGNTTAKELNY